MKIESIIELALRECSVYDVPNGEYNVTITVEGDENKSAVYANVTRFTPEDTRLQ